MRTNINSVMGIKGLLMAFFIVGTFVAKAQLRAHAAIDHIKIDGIDTQGNIILTPAGGSSPYTYSWTPGSITTKDLTNINAGTYIVKVTDNASSNKTYTYNVGYKTDWFKFYTTKFRNDTLMSDGTSYSGNRSAVTKNTLPANTDGWVQFIAPDYSYSDVIGFLDSTSVSTSNDIYDIDFALHLTSTNILYAWSSGGFTYLGTITGGDVLRLDKIGSQFKIVKNDVVLHTATALAHKKYKVKITTHTDPIANLGVSFNDTTYLEKLKDPIIAIDHVDPDDTDSLGTVTLKITTGAYPYTYKWNPGNHVTPTLSEKIANNYTLTLKDLNNDSIVNFINLGYKTRWKDYWGSSSIKDTLISNAAGTPSGSPSAFSVNELRPNQTGWIQYVVEEFGSPYVIGFADTLLPGYRGSMNDINFAVHVSYGYALYGWNGGWNYLGTTKSGDVLKLEKSGTSFILRQNGSNVFSHTAVNGKNYKIKTMLNDYIRMGSIGASFADSTTGNPLIALADVDHLIGDGVDSTGAISMRVRGGSTPYTYSWIKPGIAPVTTKHRNDIAVGTYSLRVIDNDADTISHVYNIGYKSKWSNFDGTFLRNDSLLKDGASMTSGDFPISITLDSLGNDSSGWAEHVTRSYVSPYVIGFLDSVSVSNTRNINDIDFAYHISTSNALYAWYSGSFYYLGTAEEGDAIRVGRRGTTYYIQKDSVAVCTVTLPITRAVQLKAQLTGPPYVSDWSYLVGVGVGFFKKCSGTATIVGAPEIYATLPAPVTLTISTTGGNLPWNVVWFPNVFFNTPSYNYTMMNTQIIPPVGMTYYATLTDLFGCKLIKSVTVIPTPYAPLQTIPDGGYYKLTNNKMLLKFDGQYAATSLVFNVYDKANNNVTGSTSISSGGVVNSGDNRYYLDATSLTSGQYYTLEIINEKKEKRYLRFKR